MLLAMPLDVGDSCTQTVGQQKFAETSGFEVRETSEQLWKIYVQIGTSDAGTDNNACATAARLG